MMASLMELNISDSASMTGDARVQMAKDVKDVLRSMEAPNRYFSYAPVASHSLRLIFKFEVE